MGEGGDDVQAAYGPGVPPPGRGPGHYPPSPFGQPSVTSRNPDGSPNYGIGKGVKTGICPPSNQVRPLNPLPKKKGKVLDNGSVPDIPPIVIPKITPKGDGSGDVDPFPE